MGDSNLSSSRRCLSENDLRLSAHFVEKLFIGILAPPFILFGLVGNSLTLSVLLSRHVKTRSDLLLAALALLDAFFLLLMLPNSLAHFDLFALDFTFRRVYFALKVPLLALLNQCSAAAIWVMLGVCLERFVGISRPLSVRKGRVPGTLLFIGAVLLGTFLLTFYMHLNYRCILKAFCNGSQLYSFCFDIDSPQWLNLSRANAQPIPSAALRAYIRHSPMVHALLVVFLPSVLIAVSNLALLWTLHRRDHYLALGRANSGGGGGTASKSQSLKSTQSCSLQQQPSNSTHNSRIEHRVAFTVAAIVTSFTLTQTPSAIVQVFAGPVGPKDPHLSWRALTIFLVVFGKSVNFLLFCLSSTTFRARLIQLINAKFRQKRCSISKF